MYHSLGQRMFVFCLWMMAIMMIPFVLAALISFVTSLP